MRVAYLRAAYAGLTIEAGTTIGPGCEITVDAGAKVRLRGTIVARGCLIAAGPGAVIDIAARYIGPNSVIVAREHLTIGEGTLVAEMAVIRDSDHCRPGGQPLLADHYRSGPVHIGRDVWLGARATVLKGVSIGDSATVGAAAVVTKNIPAHVTVAGLPAQPTRKDGHVRGQASVGHSDAAR